jgi:hypothetical protein
MERMARTALARVATSAAVVLGVVVGVAAPAWAPKYILGSFAFGECVLEERVGFSGDFTIESFFASGNEVWANATVTGSCVQGFDVLATVPPGVYAFPVAVSGECVDSSAVLEVRPRAALVGAVLGPDPKEGERAKITLDLASTVVDRIWMDGDPPRERARLCVVLHAIERGASATRAAKLLNELALRV